MNKYIKVLLILNLLVWSILAIVFSYQNSGAMFAENKCSDKVIEEHILSLSQSYSELQKQEMIPEIRKFLNCSTER